MAEQIDAHKNCLGGGILRVNLSTNPLWPEKTLPYAQMALGGRGLFFAQHAHFGMDSKSSYCKAAWRGSSGTTIVPASPATIFSMSANVPMAARLPVASTKLTAACTLGPIEPAGN